jgi:hypothetical protein
VELIRGEVQGEGGMIGFIDLNRVRGRARALGLRHGPSFSV